jgi:LysM repeat protein
MSGQPPIRSSIDAYRKRRQKQTPFIIGGIAILLVVIGVIILVIGFSGGGGFNLFSTQTPTPTITPSPTNTPIPTDTPTITPTPTETPTPTPSASYVYIVQEGDYLGKIIKDHGLSDNDLLLILQLNPFRGAALENSIDPTTQIVYVGQKITLPPPGMQMLTATPFPTNAAKITYVVLPGDSLGSIARKLNSTVDAIVKANKDLLKDGTATIIYPGWTLVVPINLVTPQPTSTPPAVTETPTATSTP